MTDIVDDISPACVALTATSFGDAFTMILDGNTDIVMVPNQRITDLLIHRSDGGTSILADLVNNFRTLDGRPLGHLDTLQGTIPIPPFWPTNNKIHEKYGLPRRDGHPDLLVDAYVLSDPWYEKLISGDWASAGIRKN